jgi:hypothetical protein
MNGEEKRPFGRPMRRLEGNIKMNFKEIGSETEFTWLRLGTARGLLRTRRRIS